MWHEGMIGIPLDGGYIPVKFWVKSYDKPSKFGIDNGRISKLLIKFCDLTLASYDRGWDVKPEGYVAESAMAILLHEYN